MSGVLRGRGTDEWTPKEVADTVLIDRRVRHLPRVHVAWVCEAQPMQSALASSSRSIVCLNTAALAMHHKCLCQSLPIGDVCQAEGTCLHFDALSDRIHSLHLAACAGLLRACRPGSACRCTRLRARGWKAATGSPTLCTSTLPR